MLTKNRKFQFVDSAYWFFFIKFVSCISVAVILSFFFEGNWIFYLAGYGLWCGVLALYVRLILVEKYINKIIEDLNKIEVRN